MPRKQTPYWEYIRVEPLLSLQAGIASKESELSNDEVMFIVVHQIDELWFKLALRELVTVRGLFARDRVPEQALASAVRGIRRVETIVHQLAAHFALMETMTTRDYLGFRDKLFGASGFQSAQMREIEILMGLPENERVPLGHEGSYLTALRDPDGSESPALRKRVRARLADRPSLREAILEWLHRTPIQGSTPSQPDDAARVRALRPLVPVGARQGGREGPRPRQAAGSVGDGRGSASSSAPSEKSPMRARTCSRTMPPRRSVRA